VPHSFHLPDVAATTHLGRRLGRLLGPGSVVLLSGPVGAGKTSLAQGMLREWVGVKGAPSPTFTLVHSYPGEVHHVDLYRLEAAEVAELGIEDLFSPTSRVLVEWPERARPLLPDEALEVSLSFEGEGRRVDLKGRGARYDSLLSRLGQGAGDP